MCWFTDAGEPVDMTGASAQGEKSELSIERAQFARRDLLYGRDQSQRHHTRRASDVHFLDAGGVLEIREEEMRQITTGLQPLSSGAVDAPATSARSAADTRTRADARRRFVWLHRWVGLVTAAS
ncbi:hypothetical protein [Methylosinus sp. H3A]|uniref:hypothetical protein n=1 Tax=Methylosinus sp. H3A TaxID=2785786 RepID=UPI001FEF6CE6|nr:hypothetical protein [Methylosinus sp. H3A]